MTDRELLERAAKAAGHALWAGSGGAYAERPHPLLLLADGLTVFAPLNDDGDALRLACKLRINIEHAGNFGRRRGVNCWPIGRGDCGAFEADDLGDCAATRRAITRAAAEMAP